jgi:hypothetical protein
MQKKMGQKFENPPLNSSKSANLIFFKFRQNMKIEGCYRLAKKIGGFGVDFRDIGSQGLLVSVVYSVISPVARKVPL